MVSAKQDICHLPVGRRVQITWLRRDADAEGHPGQGGWQRDTDRDFPFLRDQEEQGLVSAPAVCPGEGACERTEDPETEVGHSQGEGWGEQS